MSADAPIAAAVRILASNVQIPRSATSTNGRPPAAEMGEHASPVNRTLRVAGPGSGAVPWILWARRVRLLCPSTEVRMVTSDEATAAGSKRDSNIMTNKSRDPSSRMK
eukprot:798523-Prymnesium_polylepis.1